MEGLNGHFCHGFYPQVRPKSHLKFANPQTIENLKFANPQIIEDFKFANKRIFRNIKFTYPQENGKQSRKREHWQGNSLERRNSWSKTGDRIYDSNSRNYI